MRKQKCARGNGLRISPETLLPLLNPGRKVYIELEDMVRPRQKSLILRVPVEARETVREVLQEFVFNQRSFLMPAKEFTARYNHKRASNSRDVSDSIKPLISRPAHSQRNVSQSRRPTCSSHSSFATRECTPAHSPAPTNDRSWDLGDRSGSQSPLDTSYTEIHEKRKLIRKQLNTRDLVTAVRLDSQLKKVRTRSPSLIVKLPKSRTGMKENVPAVKWKYVNSKDLIEIRRRHLSSQCSQEMFHY